MYGIKFIWIILCFMVGFTFLLQCDGEPPETERTEEFQDQEDNERRHAEGRGDDAAPGIGEGHELDIVDDREMLAENMRELLNVLDEELEEMNEGDESEIFEEVRNDQFELNQLINETENVDEEGWDQIREEVQEKYARIAVNHNKRVRPEGAHGGRGAWLLRNIG